MLALAAVPSALLVAVTVHISTDVASAPLLWVAPLAVYLATFAVAFARTPPVSHRIAGIAAVIGLADLVLLVAFGPFDAWAVLGHLLGLFVIALYCHGELARRRPAPAALTWFYLLLSTGGVLGGLAAAILAPLFFDSVMEYPIVLAGFALLLPYGRRTASPRARLFGLLPVWTLRPALSALLLLLFFRGDTLSSSALVAQERSFFGVYRVVGYEEPERRLLYHGTTVHGAERVLAGGARESRTTYYAPASPLAEVLAAHAALVPEGARVGLVGLGTGSLACYARPADEYRFYEIDPLVVDLARAHFAALDACEPRGGITLGDARLALAAEPPGRLDLLVLDAFSSDAIPIHLLTEEAFGVYLRALSATGGPRRPHLEPPPRPHPGARAPRGGARARGREPLPVGAGGGGEREPGLRLAGRGPRPNPRAPGRARAVRRVGAPAAGPGSRRRRCGAQGNEGPGPGVEAAPFRPLFRPPAPSGATTSPPCSP